MLLLRRSTLLIVLLTVPFMGASANESVSNNDASADQTIALLNLKIEQLRLQHGNDSIELVPYLEKLALAQNGFKSTKAEHKIYREALRIVGLQHGKNSEQYANLAFRAGAAMFDRSNATIGRNLIKLAQTYYLAQGKSAQSKVGLTWFYLANMALVQHRNRKATEFFTNALVYLDPNEQETHKHRMLTHATLVVLHEKSGDSDLATPHCRAIGQRSSEEGSRFSQPLFSVHARYPHSLNMREIKGVVKISYSIDVNGFVADALVTDHQIIRPKSGSEFGGFPVNEDAFDEAALKALSRFRYAPLFVNGEATTLPEQAIVFTFPRSYQPIEQQTD